METPDKLLDIIRTLRAENGCAWDRKQTPETMWQCLIEEVYELLEAITQKDAANICEELGDVLFQLLFIIEIYQENKTLFLSDVIETVASKMIRRHPHVYGTARISSEKELFRQWDSIKSMEKEKVGQTPQSVLDAVPSGMPPLLRALKVSEIAVKQGFDWDHISEILETVKSEIREFESALQTGDTAEAAMEFGDILFSLVNVARAGRFHPETSLASSTEKFEGRYRLMEKELKEKKLLLKNLSKEEKESFWDRAKNSYHR